MTFLRPIVLRVGRSLVLPRTSLRPLQRNLYKSDSLLNLSFISHPIRNFTSNKTMDDKDETTKNHPPKSDTTTTVEKEVIEPDILESTKFSSTTGRRIKNPSKTGATGASTSTEVEDILIPPPPPPPPPGDTMSFQAETRQLLDIVTNSLYTDKEIFLRELVSNASDALEKLRHLQATGHEGLVRPTPSMDEDATDKEDIPLEIHITANLEHGTLTISDTGIGLSKTELVDNLGTIARSGSKAFLKQLKESSDSGGAPFDVSRGIIGKFGVGFYSSFMVGERVEVRSRSALEAHQSNPAVWSSDGTGTFEIADLNETEAPERGSSIVIHLKPDFVDFADPDKVESILKKYSNFVNFPIFLNGNIVNTMEAVWVKDPKEVSEETYTAFYKFISNAYDEPLDRLHFRADAPIDVKALFYIPSFHSEKYGMGQMEPGVSLYSRKILIEAKSKDILPEWMRFLKGVVDSEDLPLAVSREKPQDSALIAKLRKVLTRKFVSHLTQMAKKDPDKYKMEFYKEYSQFLKEGICRDFDFQESLAKLLYFETSKSLRGVLSSFDDYISRCTPEQKEIYYLLAPTRDMAVLSPYMEVFDKNGREVIFVFNTIDDFVMANLEKYEGRKLVSVDKADLELPANEEEEKGKSPSTTSMTPEEITNFCNWFRITLNDKVRDCKATSRLGSSPAIITDTESGALRRMMRMVEATEGGRDSAPLTKQQVELNMKHPIILGLHAIREKEPTLAKILAEQIFDNCLLAAGLLDDGRSMLPRLNDILETVLKDAQASIQVESEEEISTEIDVAAKGESMETMAKDSGTEKVAESTEKESKDDRKETPTKAESSSAEKSEEKPKQKRRRKDP